jgi:hypothetical protein
MEIIKNLNENEFRFFDNEKPIELNLDYQKFELPKKLFDGMTRQEAEEMIKQAEYGREKYSFKVDRFLVEEEINELEKSILNDVTNDLPLARSNYDAVSFEAKRMTEEAKSALKFVELRIEDAVHELKQGTAKIEISPEECFMLILAGKRVYYSFVGDSLKLVKVEDLSAQDAEKWYNSMTRNNDLLASGFFKEYADEMVNVVNS